MNVLAKTKNQVIEMGKPIEEGDYTIPDSSNGDLNSTMPRGTSFPNLNRGTNAIKFGEVGIVETQASNSPMLTKNHSPKAPLDPFVPVILGEESITGKVAKLGKGPTYTYMRNTPVGKEGIHGLKMSLQSGQRPRFNN